MNHLDHSKAIKRSRLKKTIASIALFGALAAGATATAEDASALHTTESASASTSFFSWGVSWQ